MATLREAEKAREQTAELLRELGAHAISVEEVLPDETDTAGDGAGTAAPGSPSAADAASSVATAGAAAGSTGAGTEIPAAAAPGSQGGARAGDPEQTSADTPDEEEVASGPPRRRRRRRTFAVVAWFAGEPPAALPRGLEVKAGSRTKVVPLRARREERFRAE